MRGLRRSSLADELAQAGKRQRRRGRAVLSMQIMRTYSRVRQPRASRESAMSLRNTVCAAMALGVFSAVSVAQAAPPPIVPPGWTTERVPGDRMIIRYVSPDGRAVLTMR